MPLSVLRSEWEKVYENIGETYRRRSFDPLSPPPSSSLASGALLVSMLGISCAAALYDSATRQTPSVPSRPVCFFHILSRESRWFVIIR